MRKIGGRKKRLWNGGEERDMKKNYERRGRENQKGGERGKRTRGRNTNG